MNITPESLSDAEVWMLMRLEQINIKLDHIIEKSGFGLCEEHPRRIDDLINGGIIPSSRDVDLTERLTERQKKECDAILYIFRDIQRLAQSADAPAGFAKLAEFPGFHNHPVRESLYIGYAEWRCKQDPDAGLPEPPRNSSVRLSNYLKLKERLYDAGFADIVDGDYIGKIPAEATQNTFDSLSKILKEFHSSQV